MTKHAKERLAERFPGISLEEVEQAGDRMAHVADNVSDGKAVYLLYVRGQILFPVLGEDGSVITVLTEGMTVTTPTGTLTLSRPAPSVGDDGIITLGEHEPIYGPGAYRMPMQSYHSQWAFPGPSVSSTGLRTLALQSPHAFWKTSDLNPDRYPEKEISDSLILGRAAHSLILGDEVFDEHFCYIPKGSPSRPTKTQVKAFERDGKWSAAAADGAAFWQEFDAKAAGRMLLKEEQVEKIMRMAENMRANSLAVDVLTSDLVEISMIWQDEKTGIWLKSRPDCIPSNGFDFGDLKTFSPKGKDLKLSAQRSITDFGYPMQMSLAVMGAEHVFQTTAETCALVFVQTTEPYEVIPVKINTDSLYWARVLIRQGIDRMAHGLETNEWPGVAPDIIEYEYPPSMLHRFAEMQRTGELPSV